MSDNQTVRLSDDELVCFAMRAESRWAGPLPTVDDGDPQELLRAVSRGERNLDLRQQRFLTNEGDTLSTEQVADMLAPAMGVLPRILAYIADESDPLQATGLSFAVFPTTTTDTRIVTVTLPLGITEVSVLSIKDARVVMASLVEIGEDQDSSNAVMFSASVDNGHGDIRLVTKQGSSSGQYSTEGVTISETAPTTSVSEWLSLHV